MSTYRHKGSPFYHYDFQFRGQRFHGSTGCDTKRAADEYERRERQKAALPEQRRPPITLDEACGLYQDQVETKPSWPTIRYIISALIAGIGKNRLLSSITQRDLQVHFARRRAKPDGSRSNASINREVENARAIWRLADRTRYDVGEMPDWKALRLKVPRTAPRELEAASEEARLFRHLREDVRDAVDFLLKSGWRRAEVLACAGPMSISRPRPPLRKSRAATPSSAPSPLPWSSSSPVSPRLGLSSSLISASRAAPSAARARDIR